jgi:hypothetical protein
MPMRSSTWARLIGSAAVFQPTSRSRRAGSRKAGAQGHQDAQANAGLLLFQNGNRAAALPWLRKAADRGDARAQYVLGTALFNGDIAGKDWPRAYALMSRASAQGLPQAKTSLAQMEQFISAEDKQKGSAIAAQLAKGAAISAVADTGQVVRDTRPVRIAGQAQTARPDIGRCAPAKGAPVDSIASRSVPRPPRRHRATSPRQPRLRPRSSPPTAPLRQTAPVATRAQVAGPARRLQQCGCARRAGRLVERIGFGGLQPSYEQAGRSPARVGRLPTAAPRPPCAAAKAAGQACFPVAP